MLWAHHDDSVYRFAGDNNYPPFEFIDENGEISGFNIDIIRAVASKVDLDIEIELMVWNQAMEQLEAEQVDAITGMFYSEERADNFLFSIPFINVSHTIVTRTDQDIKSIQDIEDKEIIVQKADIMHDYVLEEGISNRLILTADPDQALNMLSDGVGYCALVGFYQAKYLIEKYNLKNLKTIGRQFHPYKYSVATTKANENLLFLINEGLSILKETGAYNEIHEKWLGRYERIISPQWYRTLNIGLIVFGSFLLIFLIWLITLRIQVREKTKQLHDNNELLSVTLNSIGDAVITTDTSGFITGMNPVAERLTGWRGKRVIGRSLTDVFVVVNSQTGDPIPDLVHSVIDSGKIVGLANHTTLISKSGKKNYISDSAAPIRKKNGAVVGVVLVFRDMTDKYQQQEKLKNNEEHLRRAQSAGKIGSWEYDIKTKKIWASPQTYKIFGIEYSDGLVPSSTTKKLIHKKDYPKTIIALKKLYRDNKCDLEYRIVNNKSNKLMWINAKADLKRDDQGNPSKIVGIVQDITDRKNMEEELILNEKKYKDLFDNAPIGIYKTTPEGEILESNKTLIKILGYDSFSELSQRDLEEEGFNSDENRVDFKQEIEKHGFVDNYETVWIKKDGNPINVREFAHAIRDENGRIVAYEGTVEDITERKKARQKLIESEEKFRTLVNAIDDIIFTVNREKNITGVFGNWLEIYGIEKESILDRSIYDVFDIKSAKIHNEKITQTLQGKTVLYEWTFKKAYGEYVIYNMTSPLHNADNQIYGAVSVGRDITEMKQTEGKLRNTLLEKEVLLKEVHHRVKNNLQIISSLLNLQREKISNSSVAEMFLPAINRVRTMALVHEKLYQSEDFSDIDFSQYVTRLANVLVRSYGIQENVSLDIDIDNVSFPIDIAIPCGLLINELLSNSLKYAFPNGRDGIIHIRLEQLNRDEFMLNVGDNGIGLSDDYDLENADSLGLRLVNMLTEQLKGQLTVERENGVDFYIHLKSIRQSTT
jgi:PAS domain S-box-containing protein